MIIGNDGAINFEAHDAWQEHCIQIGKKDPWKLIRDLENEYINYIHNEKGCCIEINDPNEEQKSRMKELIKYRDSYMCERNIWQGQYIFNNYGYEQAEKYVNLNTKYTENEPYSIAVRQWFDKLRPCEGKDGQCNFICPYFGKCSKEVAQM